MRTRSQSLALFPLVLALGGLHGCGQPLEHGAPDVPLLALGGGAPQGPSGTSLEVSFRGDPGDAFQNNDGSYLDGVDDVRAIITSDGGLQFSSDLDPRRLPNRTVLIQVFSSDGAQQLFSKTPVRVEPAGTGTDSASQAAFRSLQAVGESAEARFKASWSDITFNYDLRYGTECGATAERPEEKVRVTLTAATPSRAYSVTNTAGAVLCRRPRKGNRSVESFPAQAPFLMLLTER